MFAITLTEKGGDQRRLDFDKAEITIGRGEQNGIVIHEHGVSRIHAQIRYVHMKFVIEHLNSTNGLYLNHKQIEVGRLEPGMMINLGDVTMVLVRDSKHVTNRLIRDTGESPPIPGPDDNTGRHRANKD